tara:strand:- start:585 stop:971 length:387 start_codon:yes stop_codon:yes gene_type:complete
MKSIAEGYKVIKTKEDIASGLNHEGEEVDFVKAAYEELSNSLQERCSKVHEDSNELVIHTGKEDTPGIRVMVLGYDTPQEAHVAKTQEDSTSPALPPTDKITDEVEEIRNYNTEQYMKPSMFNPKKFG